MILESFLKEERNRSGLGFALFVGVLFLVALVFTLRCQPAFTTQPLR